MGAGSKGTVAARKARAMSLRTHARDRVAPRHACDITSIERYKASGARILPFYLFPPSAPCLAHHRDVYYNGCKGTEAAFTRGGCAGLSIQLSIVRGVRLISL